MKLGFQASCKGPNSFLMRLAFLQSSGFFCRIAQIIQILVIQFLVCKALTHFLMIVFFLKLTSLELLNDCAHFGEAKPDLLWFQKSESEFNWCHIISNAKVRNVPERSEDGSRTSDRALPTRC